jgi:hypothetical protein
VTNVVSYASWGFTPGALFLFAVTPVLSIGLGVVLALLVRSA